MEEWYLPAATILRPLNSPTAAICKLQQIVDSCSQNTTGSLVCTHVFDTAGETTLTSAAKSDLSILPNSLVSSVLGVKVLLLPDVEGPVSASRGLAPELGSNDKLPVPDPEGEAASVTGPACPVTPDFRAPPPELGSKDNVLAETTDCPYSSKQGNQGQI